MSLFRGCFEPSANQKICTDLLVEITCSLILNLLQPVALNSNQLLKLSCAQWFNNVSFKLYAAFNPNPLSEAVSFAFSAAK